MTAMDDRANVDPSEQRLADAPVCAKHWTRAPRQPKMHAIWLSPMWTLTTDMSASGHAARPRSQTLES